VSSLLWFIAFGVLAGLVLFSVVFRRVREELTEARDRGVPVAVIAHRRHVSAVAQGSIGGSFGGGSFGGGSFGGGSFGGGLRARLAGSMPTVQAGIVATAAMSILVMSLCLIACMVLVVLGR
jgi:hypothetical protein